MGDNLENYDKIKVIGHGSYGEVWLVKHKNDKKEYVLKKLDLRNASAKERRGAEQECRLLSQLKHPNIVTYKESFETNEGFLYISMRFCEAGDLYTKLKQQKGKLLEEKQIVEWFIQIAMALRYMHSQNIMHRDLKTQNIFLTKNRIIKVGDLGIARVLDSSGDMAKTLIGTPYYMSPEIFSNKPYNFKSDVWALGCCVFEMVTLKHAFNGKDLNSLMYQIQRGRLPPMPEVYSVQLKTLIKAMMQRVPERRPSVDRVIKDSFIQKHIAIFLKETRKSHASKPGQDKEELGRRVKARPSNSKVERRRSSDEVLKALKCPPELEVIPEECGVQVSSSLSSLEKKNCDGDVGGGVDGDRKVKELEAVEDHHHHHHQQVHQDHHHNDEEGGGDRKPHQVIIHSKSDPSLARQSRRLGAQKPSKVLNEGPQAKEVVTVAPNASLESQDIQRSLPSKSSSSKSRPTSSKGSRPLPALGSHSPNRGVPLPIKSSSDPVRHDENPGRNFPSSSSASSSSSSLSSSSSVSVSANVERSKPRNDFSASSVADDEEVMDSTRPDTARSGARERRRLRVMNENLVNIDITKSKLLMSASNENDQIRKSVDKSMSSSASASSSSSFERRKSDPDTKPSSSNPTSGLTKCSRQERPLSTDGKRLKDRKKVTGFGKGGGDGDDDDDESNTSPESGTPEEIDEEESDMKSDRKEMKKFIYLLGTLTLRRKNDDDDDAGDDDNDGGDEEEDDENTSLKNVKQGSEEEPPSLRNAVTSVGRIQQLQQQQQQQLQQQQQVSEINKDCDLTSTGVLYNRISSLRRDCVRGIGVLRLRRAYEILDKFDEEEIGPPLVNLLGQSDYDNYAGKIMQLKYYEDTVNSGRR